MLKLYLNNFELHKSKTSTFHIIWYHNNFESGRFAIGRCIDGVFQSVCWFSEGPSYFAIDINHRAGYVAAYRQYEKYESCYKRLLKKHPYIKR